MAAGGRHSGPVETAALERGRAVQCVRGESGSVGRMRLNPNQRFTKSSDLLIGLGLSPRLVLLSGDEIAQGEGSDALAALERQVREFRSYPTGESE
jgi:hypothetical protein